MDTPIDAQALIGPAEELRRIFATFTREQLPPFVPVDGRYPKWIHLDDYPKQLVDDSLSDATSHTQITMAHSGRDGIAFPSVLGFNYLDGKITVLSRPNAAKIPHLERDPSCSFLYHNYVANPSQMANITLVGKARVIHEPEFVHRANVAMSHKAFRDSEIGAGGVEAMIEAMDAVDRRAIVLEQINAIYLMFPAPPELPSGMALPVVSWRANAS